MWDDGALWDYGAPPRLILFEVPATDLLRVIRPKLGSHSTADNVYNRPSPNDSSFIGVRNPVATTTDRPTATTRLIPIPMAWAAYFIDCPAFGVAVRRLNYLMDYVSRLERTQLSPILDSLVLGFYGDREDPSDAYSTLGSDWTLLPLHPKTKAWTQASWARCTSVTDDPGADITAGLPNPEDDKKLPARRRSPGTSPAKRPAPSPTGPHQGRKRTNLAHIQPAMAPPSFPGVNLSDLGSLVTQLLATQADSSLRMHQSFQANMLENPGAAPTGKPRKPKREAVSGGGHGKQATKNSSIPPLCATVVREFNRLHPTLDISTFVRKTGIKYMDVKAQRGTAPTLGYSADAPKRARTVTESSRSQMTALGPSKQLSRKALPSKQRHPSRPDLQPRPVHRAVQVRHLLPPRPNLRGHTVATCNPRVHRLHHRGGAGDCTARKDGRWTLLCPPLMQSMRATYE